MPDWFTAYTADYTPAEARALALALAAAMQPKPHFWTPKTPEELAEADKRVKACVAEMIGNR